MRVREKVADLCHQIWCSWMRHMFKNCTKMSDGTVIVPKRLVDRWCRQIRTPYEDLSETEKDSDREEARKFMNLLQNS